MSLFHGNDPARWQPQVSTYANVDLGAVWPGIGVTLKAYGKQVEKVFTVEPGAAPETIRVRAAGAQSLTVAADGGLAVHTGVGDVRLTPPVAYQEIAGTRRMLDAAYMVAGDQYGFHLSGYDPTRPVVTWNVHRQPATYTSPVVGAIARAKASSKPLPPR